MNKICGYNCEHNKGGICQITYCDKIGEITTTTQWLSGGRQQGKTHQLIKNMQKEIEKLNNIIKDLKQKNNLAENILYDYLYNDDKITKEKYKQFKGLKEGKQ